MLSDIQSFYSKMSTSSHAINSLVHHFVRWKMLPQFPVSWACYYPEQSTHRLLSFVNSCLSSQYEVMRLKPRLTIRIDTSKYNHNNTNNSRNQKTTNRLTYKANEQSTQKDQVSNHHQQSLQTFVSISSSTAGPSHSVISLLYVSSIISHALLAPPAKRHSSAKPSAFFL